MFFVDEMGIANDYTSPNETGTPSPAPATSSSATAALPHRPPTASGQHQSSPPPLAATTSPLQPPPTTVGAGGGGDRFEYSSAVVGKKSSALTTGFAATQSGPEATVWKNPPYERIVRGVECIIVRIRGLLDVSSS